MICVAQELSTINNEPSHADKERLTVTKINMSGVSIIFNV